MCVHIRHKTNIFVLVPRERRRGRGRLGVRIFISRLISYLFPVAWFLSVSPNHFLFQTKHDVFHYFFHSFVLFILRFNTKWKSGSRSSCPEFHSHQGGSLLLLDMGWLRLATTEGRKPSAVSVCCLQSCLRSTYILDFINISLHSTSGKWLEICRKSVVSLRNSNDFNASLTKVVA